MRYRFSLASLYGKPLTRPMARDAGSRRHLLSAFVGQWTFVRNERAGGLLEDFFISAVVAVLGIRLYILLGAGTVTTKLTVTLPASAQSAAGTVPAELHFAHILWGGLLMLVALVVLLAFLSRSAKELAAIVGGVGFGAFIDELGKFITGDNNYFFQPAIALIYVTFVLLFIVIRAIQRPRWISPENAKANALEVAKQMASGEAGAAERWHALGLLAGCDQRDPSVAAVRRLLWELEPAPARQPHPLARAKGLLRRLYDHLVRTRWFPTAVIAFFVLQSIGSLYITLATVAWAEALLAAAGFFALAVPVAYVVRRQQPPLQTLVAAGLILVAAIVAWAFLLFRRDAPGSLLEWFLPFVTFIEPGTGFRHTLLNVVGVFQFLAPTLSGVLVVFGVLLLWHSRLAAYRMFHNAVLVSIFLTQVFIFYENQLLGVVGLLPNLLILAVVRFLIGTTEAEGEKEEAAAVPTTG